MDSYKNKFEFKIAILDEYKRFTEEELNKLLPDNHKAIRNIKEFFNDVIKKFEDMSKKNSRSNIYSVESSKVIGNFGEVVSLIYYAHSLTEKLKFINPNLDPEMIEKILQKSIAFQSHENGFDIVIAIHKSELFSEGDEIPSALSEWDIHLIESKYRNSRSSTSIVNRHSSTNQNDLDFITKTQTLHARIEEIVNNYDITDVDDPRLLSLLDEFEHQYLNELTLSRVLDGSERSPFFLYHITNNGKLKTKHLSYGKVNNMIDEGVELNPNSRIWPDISNSDHTLNGNLFNKYDPSVGDGGVTPLYGLDTNGNPLEIIIKKGGEDFKINSINQKRVVTVNKFGDELRFDGKTPDEGFDATINIIKVDLTPDELKSIIAHNSAELNRLNAIIIPKYDQFESGSLISRLANDLLVFDNSVDTYKIKTNTGDFIDLQTNDFDIATGRMINLFSENHSSDITKVNSFVTTNPNDMWSTSQYSNAYKFNPIHISERLSFIYGGLDDFHSTVRGLQLELQANMIPRFKELGLSDEQISLVKNSIDDIFAEGDFYDLSTLRIKNYLERHLFEINQEIDEILDSPIIGSTARFPKPNNGPEPPEGILVTKGDSSEASVLINPEFDSGSERIIQHLYIDPKKETMFLPQYRDLSDLENPKALQYKEIKIFEEENGYIKLNWDEMFITKNDINKYLSDHTKLSSHQIDVIGGDWYRITGDGEKTADDIRKEIIYYFGKRPEPTQATRIKIFSLIHMKRTIHNRLRDLVDGVLDNEIASLARKIESDDLVRQTIMFGTVIEEYKKIGQGIDLDPDSMAVQKYPDVKDLNDLLRIELANSLNDLVKAKGGVSQSIVMNYAMLSIMYKKLNFEKTYGARLTTSSGKVTIDNPWKTQSVYNDLSTLLIDGSAEEGDISMIRAYKPGSDVHIKERLLADSDDNFSSRGSIFHRSLFGKASSGDHIYDDLIEDNDPFAIFLDTFYYNVRLGTPNTPDRTLQYMHFLDDLRAELEVWVQSARKKYKSQRDRHAFDLIFEPYGFDSKKKRLGNYFQGIDGDTSLEQHLRQMIELIKVMQNLNRLSFRELFNGVNPIIFINTLLRSLLF